MYRYVIDTHISNDFLIAVNTGQCYILSKENNKKKYAL